MYDVAISIIQEYVDEYLFMPAINWPDNEFNERCYSRWAADELIFRMKKESKIPPKHISGIGSKSPFKIIEDFIDEMEYFSKTTYDKKHRFMFSTARDTAIDIIYLFL